MYSIMNLRKSCGETEMNPKAVRPSLARDLGYLSALVTPLVIRPSWIHRSQLKSPHPVAESEAAPFLGRTDSM